ncbi:hypothetical protein LEP1GSC132_1138 [Leptospira kirschneri str. 200803703]|uniref:Uncharacterized protein n=1 Tax=Leptospira kirschneri str. 200802841 TaxID=1193047 RepID=A0A828Y5T1_9LEPT|nr:hypothetical protein LEP1GSC131_4487 [Leptospira kirschneri str. 200802841]EMK16653.1 hypothetical protein LEP1GSC042_1844 [Leptospira kirschneri serovar Bim str. PUO 1247]EMN06852.1 hypothetical protein LEP1GSC046_2990 [Leptospira kirschneri serovar Bim str. 1051]EMO68770.1 hypothetical protein LEP1GSC132_1138 [Leptospira kirschneri str. 200803703]EMO74301.1 hypothetical protein LEP1GSC127_4204 [Leptospira kirschneri str. 200801925]EMO80215.1 hypothetical protein LEP1GSC126_3316 [Leptospir
MQKFDWTVILYRFYRGDREKRKPQKTIFFSAVLFKGTKDSKYLVQKPKK